ncbi:hypothetical protein [Streptomyces cadmiisoli]|uniref:RICIN domain-containing protein n=1 Tax=Streptomyces cadmiisoli TaxID=2184053 RepID=UPI003D74387E
MNDLKAEHLTPSVPELLDRARALALIDGIHEPDTWEYGGYRLERWDGHESCLTLSAGHVECRLVDVHISDAGCLVLGYDVDESALFGDELQDALTAHVPAALHACCRSNSAQSWLRGEDGAYAGLGFALWRTPADKTWRQVSFDYDHGAMTDESRMDDPEAARLEPEVFELLSDLISPRPEQLVLGTEYVRGASLAEVTWPRTGLTRSEAIRHVIALRPLTEQVVRTLSRHISLDDATALAARLGYPLDGSRAQESVPGAGTAVMAGVWAQGLPMAPWVAFALEASQDGGHRISARHTGTVWDVVGEGTDARVIHAEPRPGDSQRFIIQRVSPQGTYTETDTWERYGRYRILTAGSRLAVEAPAEGSPLLLAPPHGGASQHFQADHVFLGDAELPNRHYYRLETRSGIVGTHLGPDWAEAHHEQLPSPAAEMVEPFGGGKGIRFRIRNVKIDGQGNVVRVRGGGTHEVSFDLLHDCSECGGAINQVIVGLAGEDRAQASVWNGKQRSEGSLRVVNRGTAVEAMAEENPGSAEWVNVVCDIVVPDEPGTYSVRARYAQAWQGRLMTAEGRAVPQPEYQDVLGWWKVDRPDGPGPESAIGTIVVEP